MQALQGPVIVIAVTEDWGFVCVCVSGVCVGWRGGRHYAPHQLIMKFTVFSSLAASAVKCSVIPVGFLQRQKGMNRVLY